MLLWLGEAAFDLRGQRTLRALVQVLQRAAVDFAVLGADELDCGDLARRLGDEATFAELARRNVETLAKRRFARILTADPHVLHALRNEYPAFGGRYEVWHHSAYLLELVRSGRLPVRGAALDGALTFHDPCYLGRYNGDIESPRQLLIARYFPFLQRHLRDVHPRLAPHHLRRSRLPFPHKCRSQDVVPLDDLLHCLDVPVQQLPVGEHHLAA